jgi:hypothetical protein
MSKHMDLDMVFDSHRIRTLQPILYRLAKAHEQVGSDILAAYESDALRQVAFAQYEGAVQALELAMDLLNVRQKQLAEAADEQRAHRALDDLLNGSSQN